MYIIPDSGVGSEPGSLGRLSSTESQLGVGEELVVAGEGPGEGRGGWAKGWRRGRWIQHCIIQALNRITKKSSHVKPTLV